jgi:sugar phosphate permease
MAFIVQEAANEDSVRDPAETSPTFRYWQWRVLLSSMIGYAAFYFVRTNFSFAVPGISAEYGFSKEDLGWCMSVHGMFYGVSRFANGVWADRANARWFMASGLAICGGINLLTGASSTMNAFTVLWAVNGWFQGMGFPPCTRLMTHWFSPQRLASTMSLWNVGHSLGGAGVAVLCGYLAGDDWRLCFYVPAGVAFVGALFLVISLRDTPEKMGLPPVRGTEHTPASASEPLWVTLRQLVFSNHYIWLLSAANFFVYIVRYGIISWAPTFLKEARGFELSHEAGWTVGAFEVAGILGMLSSGWVTDYFFGGRGTRTCLVYMIGCGSAILAFWMYPSNSVAFNGMMLAIAGFFIYGPQCLIGIAAANLATKRAAAASAGLTGLFGYASAPFTGKGIGWLADTHGWNSVFVFLAASAGIGTLLFALCWPAKAHGYE